MAGLQLVCPTCGYGFVDQGFAFDGPVTASMKGCATSCPRCRAIVDIDDGVYQATAAGIVERIRALDPTEEEIVVLTRILQSQAALGGPKAVAREIETELPRIAVPLNDLLLSIAQWKKFLPLLLSALATLSGFMADPTARTGLLMAAATASAAFALGKDKTPEQEQRERQKVAEAVVDEQDRRRRQRNAAKRERKAQRHRR